MQVCLCLNEMYLEFSPGIFRLQLGAPGPAVFLKLAGLCNEDLCHAYDLSFCDGISRRGCIIYACVEPRIEDLEWIFRVEGFPHLLVVL